MEDSTAVCNPYYGNVRKVNPQGASEQTDTANPFVLITIYKASLPDIRIMPGHLKGVREPTRFPDALTKPDSPSAQDVPVPPQKKKKERNQRLSQY